MSAHRPAFGPSSSRPERRHRVLRPALGIGAGALVLTVLAAGGAFASGWFGAAGQPVARSAAGAGAGAGTGTGAGGSVATDAVVGLPAPPPAVRRAIEKLPPDRPARGLVHRGLTVAVGGTCAGLYELKSLPGRCSHGPDTPQGGSAVDPTVSVAALPPEQTVAAAARAAASGTARTTATGVAAAQKVLPCYGNGTAGNRVQVLYVYADTDRSARYLESIRTWAVGVDDIFVKSAAATGGVRHVRFLTQPAPGGCLPVVTKVRVPAGQLRDFDATTGALAARGFNRTDRKYLMFAESTVYCGIGTFTGDARKGASNRNNVGPSYSRVDSGCWNSKDATHELAHNLGAVVSTAPNGTRGGHCVDDWDVMCYSDGPDFPRLVIKCPNRGHENVLDCGNDDYFSTAPRPGSFLANNYNIADNPFLAGGRGGGAGPNPTPNPTPKPTATKRPIPPKPNGRSVFRLRSERSGLCLGVPRAQLTRPGARIVQLPCRARDTGQQFSVRGDMLVVKGSGMCVSVVKNSRRSGALVVQQRCGAAAGSRRMWATGKVLGFRHSGQCMDVGTAAVRRGAPVVQRPCRGTVSQRLKVV